MNASRRTARKHNVLNNGLAEAAAGVSPVRRNNILKGVLKFVTTAPHKMIAKQAVKLGLITRSPMSLHQKRTGIATR